MTVYLLIDKETKEVVNVYKYADVALASRDKRGLFTDKSRTYRVEVMKVIE